MDGKKHSTSSSSSSSFTADLFGSKESSSSSFFNTIFPPPSKAHGKEYISSETTKKNYDFATIQDSAEKKDKSRNPKMDMSPFYDQEKSQPCPLSSSIYYGGQDIYPNPHSTKNNPGHSTQYNKDGEDDGRASRGNWWQGSLYY
ncbi:protein involved in salt tolerance [Artemisia annua]|uniref:Protein involved in salt tolerance n=1 Tax=Artemisia annua TaxID=35608 RepID=A0A2U1MFM0_ARTAN|nr:protein involved in salt tolerance [Artemisia annua]